MVPSIRRCLPYAPYLSMPDCPALLQQARDAAIDVAAVQVSQLHNGVGQR